MSRNSLYSRINSAIENFYNITKTAPDACWLSPKDYDEWLQLCVYSGLGVHYLNFISSRGTVKIYLYKKTFILIGFKDKPNTNSLAKALYE